MKKLHFFIRTFCQIPDFCYNGKQFLENIKGSVSNS